MKIVGTPSKIPVAHIKAGTIFIHDTRVYMKIAADSSDQAVDMEAGIIRSFFPGTEGILHPEAVLHLNGAFE